MKDSTLELKRLYDHYAKELYVYGMAICADKVLVEDAIQDVFLYIHLHDATFSHAADKKLYLLAALRNKIYRMSHGRQPRFEEMTVESEMEYSAEDRIIGEEQWRINQERVKEMLDSLSMRQREVLYLRFIETMSFKEISEHMSINRQSAQNLFQRAVKRLREVFLAETLTIEK